MTFVEIVQLAGEMAVVIAVVFSLLQLGIMRRQLNQERDVADRDRELTVRQFEQLRAENQGQNAFELVKFLEQPEHLAARARMTALADKDLSEWTAEERAAADTVARIWQVAAAFQDMGVVPENFLERLYGGTIVRHWTILRPFIEDLRRRTDPAQRIHFQAVAERVIEQRLAADRERW